MKQGEKMLKKLTQQATDLILHSIASGEVMGANLLITKGNEELVYACLLYTSQYYSAGCFH